MSIQEATIDNLYERQFLSELDYRFARFLGRLDGTFDVDLLLAASLVSRYRGEGHICIDLAELAGTIVEPQGSERNLGSQPLWHGRSVGFVFFIDLASKGGSL